MHAMGIVHRDLKPENILCIEDSATKQIDVKVADFGIAKKIGRARAKSTCGSPGCKIVFAKFSPFCVVSLLF
jgi:serine/threonine protein kinase